jgi:calpain-15
LRGLPNDHAYSLLKTYRVDERTHLVQIRNPWGKTEWNGDWSDNSNKWTPALRQELGVTSEDDGTFWMELKDFRKYFSTVSVCKYIDEYNYTYKNFCHPTLAYMIFPITVNETGEYTFGVTLKPERATEHDFGNARLIFF